MAVWQTARGQATLGAMPHRKHIAQDPYTSGKTLDIGYAEFPNHTTKNLYGIDIAPTPSVPLPNYVETKQVDLNHDPIPYPDEFFDTVIGGDVIEHVANPMALLCEANRVLKPGGTIIISTPNPIMSSPMGMTTTHTSNFMVKNSMLIS